MQATQAALQDAIAAPVPLPTTAQGAEHMVVTVTGVKGAVQYSNDNGDTWKLCTVGLVLGEGTEFRTGLGSSVTFTLPPNQTITLERLGTIKLLQAIKDNGKYTTDVGMKYGQTKYEVQAAGIEHESTVRTPNSTLAVRGTNLIVTDERPFPPQAQHFEGIADWNSGGRRQTLAHGNSTAVGGQLVADTSLLNSVVDPNIAFARTQNEVPLVANLLSRGAVFQQPNDKGIPVVTGGVPPTDAQLPLLLPGALDFVLRWDGPANLDLTVGNNVGTGEIMYPATTLNRTPSGGLIPFDHRGGPKGGIEIGFWSGKFPNGLYPVFASNVSGATVNFEIDAYIVKGKDRELQPIRDTSTDTDVLRFKGTIAPGQQSGAIAQINEFIPMGPTLPFSVTAASLKPPKPSPTAAARPLTGGSGTAQFSRRSK
jgi:hypothetical protein